MSYIGDFALGSTFDTKFTTVSTTGAPTTLAGTPVISAYLDNNVTQLTAGITLTVDFDAVTGLHNVRVVATSGNGYAAGVNYQLVITTGTVGGTSVVGYVVAEFSIEARSAVRPTTAGRTLDISAAGEAGVDWANIGAPTTAQGLTGTTIATSQVVASVSGAVGSVTGAVGSVTGAVGSVTGAVGSVTARVTANTDQLAAQTVTAAAGVTFPTSVASPTNITAGTVTTATNVTNISTGGIAAASFAAGAVDAAAIAANALGTSEVASAVDDRIVSANWNKARTSHTTQGTFGESQNAVISGAAIAGTLSTTQMTTDLTNATDSSMNGRTIVFIGNGTAALKGQATNATAYVGATKLITFTAVTTAPAAGDQFLIF